MLIDREVVEQLALERALHLAVAEQARAGFREPHSGRAADEEALLQLQFELLDPLRERWLCHVQAGRRSREATRVGDGVERVKLVGRERH